ncbi:restriction endonuclease subunit S [Campylobacter sp.]|uniref:restriction endonuclease subunit S n=1 Tax=Campylobacter sp. TaxID=205 RepID=UPI00259D177C|nr:restriction endonuclease subunit S [Campylobacter sp.]MBQ8819685.1 restriction endonuclease subunit S [Campylobacter sp.]
MNKIPKGWEVKKLGDIAITSSGGTPLRTHSEYWNGNIKWLKISDLNDSLIDNSDEFITEIGLKNSSAKILKKGTLLVAMYGSIGKLGILNTEATTNQAICAIINKKDKKFEIKFLFYFFMSAKEKMLNESFGGVQKNISQTYLKNLEIPLPNLTEQKAIADKLDDSFAKIENAITNLINAKENLKLYKQSVLKSAFNGDLLPNTSPTHWEVKKLGEIISKEKYSMKRGPFGSALKKEFFVDNGIRVFEQYNPINSDPHWKRYFITKEKFKELEAFKASAGDLLISCSGTLGKILELPKNTEIGIINQALLKIKLDQKQILNSFFIHYFNSNKFQNLILEKTIGTAIKNIASVSELKQLEIPLPNLTEQNLIVAEIDRRFAIVDKTLNLIDKNIQNAKNLKQSILKKAFSGELRSDI